MVSTMLIEKRAILSQIRIDETLCMWSILLRTKQKFLSSSTHPIDRKQKQQRYANNRQVIEFKTRGLSQFHANSSVYCYKLQTRLHNATAHWTTTYTLSNN